MALLPALPADALLATDADGEFRLFFIGAEWRVDTDGQHARGDNLLHHEWLDADHGFNPVHGADYGLNHYHDKRHGGGVASSSVASGTYTIN
jgi:hypothetical protein